MVYLKVVKTRWVCHCWEIKREEMKHKSLRLILWGIVAALILIVVVNVIENIQRGVIRLHSNQNSLHTIKIRQAVARPSKRDS
jgi:hypothetical protein